MLSETITMLTTVRLPSNALLPAPHIMPMLAHDVQGMISPFCRAGEAGSFILSTCGALS
jgi:hypothetical protein